MKTNRLYYHNAYLKTFGAHIIERIAHAGQPAVVLDQTALYPTGGGQPHDTGKLNSVQVTDVIEREADGAVLHLLAGELGDNQVNGEIDWIRRFDHMQQHSGQHILSQAFIQIAQAETVGFHLGQDNVTIDLDHADLSPATIQQVEDMANQIVFEDRPVTARFVTPGELEHLPLRKPPKAERDIRVVQIEGFDWSACGGTHVSSAGQIGLIKIIRLERRGKETRVEFCCGQRALADYDRKNEMLAQVAAGLSVGYWELDKAVSRLLAENKEARKKLAEAEGKLMLYEASELAAQAQEAGPFKLVAHAWAERDAAALRLMAKKIIEQPKRIALLGSGGAERSALVFARSPDVEADMAAWLRQAASRLGGKGGGQSELAQGGSGPASIEQVQAALDWVASQLGRSAAPTRSSFG